MFKDKEFLRNNIVLHRCELKPPENYFSETVYKLEKYLFEMHESHEYWARERGTSVEKARDDDKCGKISEIFVDSFLFQHYGFPGNGVDFEVRKNINKGWQPDLQYGDFIFPIKSCPRMYGDDHSWVFQFNNKCGSGGRDPVISTKNKEICFFVINEEFKNITPDSKVVIFASSPMNLISHILKPPIFDKYKGLKKCIYSKDILKLKLSCCV